MKRNILLAICLLAGICLGRAFEVNGIHYTIIDGEAVVINESQEDKVTALEYVYSGSMSKSSYSGDIVIPPTVDYEGKTYQVTGIAQWAFASTDKITSVVFPEGIKHVGIGCFYQNHSITSLEFPDSVEKIGVYACYLMKSLERAKLPEVMDTIPEGMFGSSPSYPWHVPLKEVVMPTSCKIIGGDAFYALPELETCVLPGDLEEIEGCAFYMCEKLKMTLPAGLRSLGHHALFLTLSPVNQDIPENLELQLGSYYGARGLVHISIPERITTIPDQCFSGCSNAETLEFNGNVDTIGLRSFSGLLSLKAVILPSSIQYIGSMAFLSCKNLRTAYARMKTPPSLKDREFGSEDAYPQNPDDAVVYVPVGCKEAYKQAGWDKFFAEIIEMSETEQKAAFDEIATGISTVKAGAQARAESWYDLQGRQVTRPEKGRIYIHDGRKVVK